MWRWALSGLAVSFLVSGTATAGPDTAKLYAEQCAQCHGAQRLGAIGPALLPENLRRLRKKPAARVIASGRAATQMPAFGDKLTKEQIAGLVGLIFTPPATAPKWGEAEIRASHVVNVRLADLPAKPVHNADPLNMFVVVESGDHHITLLDGDRMEPIRRFPSRFALHGGRAHLKLSRLEANPIVAFGDFCDGRITLAGYRGQ